MRKEMTPAEKHLWYNCLRNHPVKFRRQRPFGVFIVDFYAPSIKLVIEVDGDSHFTEQGKAYDEERTIFLESLGLTVLRFTNSEVLDNLAGVDESIRQHLPPCLAPRAIPPAQLGGRRTQRGRGVIRQ